jgi:cytochrome o ubiquinol oxidase subunit I
MKILGKLTWEAIPWDQPIPLIAGALVITAVVAVVAWVVVTGRLPYFWREWITSVDHKRIGVMYCLLGLLMLLRGFIDAIMMRSQQALAFHAPGYLPPEHYDQIFSAHGTIMIFFAAMPLMIGLMNFAVPLQLGVRDVAFPTLNSTGFWLTATGALLVNLSLVIGEFSRANWLPYPPLSELPYSPGVGVDYYLWALLISGIGTLMTGINFVTTILKTRAPGMSYLRMPMFCWTALASNMLIIAAFPILTATLAMLALDRYLGFHFFTNEAGGNMMMFINLIWAWGHPEVYILVLPAFGIFSEVISTFSGKPLFNYRSMVAATLGICLVSYMVWLHHFFTMGAGPDVNGIFGIASAVIAIPTGVKVYNWLFTMYGGRIRFATPMLWAIGFMVSFVIGGMTGVLLATVPADFVVHNSLFLVAHFHNVIIASVVFASFAGATYWFPKAFGFRLDEGWGKAAFWLSFIGLWAVFVPLYAAGLLGMTRRLQHYDVAMWQPWILIAAAGIVIMACAALCQVTQLAVSIRRRGELRDETGDPWNGRSLEWATLSPPPAFNFAVLFNVRGAEPYWDIKQRAIEAQSLPAEPRYEAIEMPRNSPTGFITAFFATIVGFSMIWHIWWLAGVGLAAAYAVFVWFAWRDVEEYKVPAGEVARIDRALRQTRAERVARLSSARADMGTAEVLPTTPGLDPHKLGRSGSKLIPSDVDLASIYATGRGEAGPASKRVNVGYGFWLFLVSDIIMFSAFFAAHAVLQTATAGGPSGRELFHLPSIAVQTGFLLASSFTCGLAAVATDAKSQLWTQMGLLITGLLGLGFLLLEGRDFATMVAQGAGPQRSAFLSSMFTLVGCHGVHVSAGLLWLGTMMAQVFVKGFRPNILRRLLCFNLFWHTLDIIWVALFTVVYLVGVLR